MKPNRLALIVLVALSAPFVSSAENTKHTYVPKAGFVPNAATAVRIAEAVWLPIYGETVLKKKPFKARLENEVWIVEGSLPENMLGGVPAIEISKKDGTIFRVGHGQ